MSGGQDEAAYVLARTGDEDKELAVAESDSPISMLRISQNQAEFLAERNRHIAKMHKGAWIQTHGGRAIDILDPTPESIQIEDIAFSLARMCRFNCHAEYTVADHSIRVAMLVSDELRLPALLHDAHEALWGFGDVAAPAKQLISHILAPIAQRIDAAIAQRFGFAPELFNHAEIKQADLVMLATEKKHLMSPSPRPWAALPEPVGGWFTPRCFGRVSQTDFLFCFHQWYRGA